MVEADEQLAQLMAHSRLRKQRVAEILAGREQMGASFFAAMSESLGVPPTPHLVELLTVADAVTEGLVMVLKAYTAVTEPVQRSPFVVPLVPPDGMPSMPSVRATLGSLRSELLRGLMAPDDARHLRMDALDVAARRGGMNEVVAGTHFVSDVVAGYHLGVVVGRVFKALAGEGPPPQPWDGRVPDAAELLRAVDDRVSSRAPQVDGCYSLDAAPLWREIWCRAAHELAASAIR